MANMKKTYGVTFKIADVIVKIKSRFPMAPPGDNAQGHEINSMFLPFVYTGDRKPHIAIDVEVARNLPDIPPGAKELFHANHQGEGASWRLFQNSKGFIYRGSGVTREQIATINPRFTRIECTLLARDCTHCPGEATRKVIQENNGMVWFLFDVAYDFLQILLLQYLSRGGRAIMPHAAGIRDATGDGFLFAGKSGSGKTTTAKLWARYTKATVLNDDRVIIKQRGKRFFIYPSPWSGQFQNSPWTPLCAAPLKNIYFIHHAPENILTGLSEKEAFTLLWQVMFPPFWDRGALEHTLSFCHRLSRDVACHRLGFINNRAIIDFVRTANTQTMNELY
ncbi:MAG: hypothetical protein JW844_08055 [Candidatus Omnitrophica bacterium]|nr:hypothetical protein [Candidatus Omnitrophota bacterium]